MIVFTTIFLFARIGSFANYVYSIHMIWSDQENQYGSLTLINMYFMIIGEASIPSCYVSLNYIWLDIIDQRPKEISYFIIIALIWLSLSATTLPYVLFSNMDMHYYIIPFTLSIIFLLVFSVMGIIVSFKSITSFSSFVRDDKMRNNFKKKGYFTALSGLILVSKTAVFLYLVSTYLNSKALQGLPFYIVLIYFTIELVPMVFINSIFEPDVNHRDGQINEYAFD
eukprot:TRINITY_DN4804_c0_g1_i2.p1 TRINITY_DN4804_c0_g1~~TRINITY_DN4804_c0_g1_i2.p1  ORF type:complete len:225 (+),score=8.37 TRINITY_DN4804_c0_g1_i2:227-901(+)